ncbi:unnamed protein product [Symbiodinium natans]|uniref:Uncharacterized protein n=1 Tax=Symbiodinium natans TaxID=878477 RepID=A0A812J6I7_9DINO|nr:unnamed protein product [Symbiodinium natans]
MVHSLSVLNRLITWSDKGIEIEANPRHVNLALAHLNLGAATSVSTPLVKSTGDEDDTPLSAEYTALYRSIAMRIGYLSSDRPDMLRKVRELAKGLKEPTQYHWNLLKRAGRYRRPRRMRAYEKINNWHCGAAGPAVVKATAKGQAVIAPREKAEHYGLISTSSACLGKQATLADWGTRCPVVINMDAAAGISIGSRRVSDVSSISKPASSGFKRWLLRAGSIGKSPYGEYVSDLMTQPLDSNLIQKIREDLRFL